MIFCLRKRGERLFFLTCCSLRITFSLFVVICIACLSNKPVLNLKFLFLCSSGRLGYPALFTHLICLICLVVGLAGIPSTVLQCSSCFPVFLVYCPVEFRFCPSVYLVYCPVEFRLCLCDYHYSQDLRSVPVFVLITITRDTLGNS